MRGDLGRWEIARRVNSLLTLCGPGPPVNGLLSAAAGKKKKKGLHTEPWKRRGMGQLCRRSPAPRQADKGRSEEAGESRASGRWRENGNRFPMHATFYFRFAVLRVRTHKSLCSLLRVSDESGDDASARTCIASSANFVFPSVSCRAGF